MVTRASRSDKAREFARKNVCKSLTIHADERASATMIYLGLQKMNRVYHDKEYETEEGVDANHAESFISSSSPLVMLSQ